MILFLFVPDFDYFEDRPHDVVQENRRRVNMQIHERFRTRDNNNPLNLSIPEFVKLYRMPQDEVVNLCNILRRYVPEHTSPQQTPLLRKVCGLYCCVAVLFLFNFCLTYSATYFVIFAAIDCSIFLCMWFLSKNAGAVN